MPPSRTALYRCIDPLLRIRLSNEPIFEALMVALEMVVRHELVDGPPQGTLPNEDHAPQAFFLE